MRRDNLSLPRSQKAQTRSVEISLIRIPGIAAKKKIAQNTPESLIWPNGSVTTLLPLFS